MNPLVVCISISLYVCLYMCLYVCLYVSLTSYAYLLVSLCMFLCVCLCVSMCLCVCLCHCGWCICLCDCVSEKAYKGHNKYWCRGKYGRVCRKIVETEGEEKEKRNGRVSIRDHTDNLTFTVTMENLNMNDAGSYWCRIQTIWILDVLSWDPSVQVEVSVFPGKSSLWSSSRAYG